MSQESNSDKERKSGFSENAADIVYKSGAPYRWTIHYFSKLLKPFLDRIVDDYVNEAIKRNHAENNPELREILITEITNRPDAHGRILDVIDTIPRTVIRSTAAVALAVIGNAIDGKFHNRDSRIFKWVGFGAASSLIMNQVVELFRSVYRFMAGFEGSEVAALEKYKKLSGTYQPQNSGDTRTLLARQQSPVLQQTNFAHAIPQRGITPDEIASKKTGITIGK